MRFQVPQFIEVEDKIFGPFTFKQFIYLVGGIGLSYMTYRFLPIIIALPLIFAVVGLTLALAFYKINNRPFLAVIQSGFYYLISNKLFLWRKEVKTPQQKAVVVAQKPTGQIYVPKLTESKLNDLTWSLDIQETLRKE